MCSVDDIVDEFVDMNIQEENASKPLKLEGPSKKESEERSQPTLKDDLLKDWKFKKAHLQDFIIGDTIKRVTTRSYT